MGRQVGMTPELRECYARFKLAANCGSPAVVRRFRQLVWQCNPATHPEDDCCADKLAAFLCAYEALFRHEVQRERAAGDGIREDSFWVTIVPGSHGEGAHVHGDQVHAEHPGHHAPGESPRLQAVPPRRRPAALVRLTERPALVFPVDLTFEEAMLGRLIEFEGLDAVIAIPSGVDHGNLFELLLPGPPPAERIGLEIRITPHPLYRRQGTLLRVRAPVSAARAAAGGHLRVPIPGEVVHVDVPRGSRRGDAIRVPGKGIWSPTGRGDLLVELVDSSRQAG